MTLGMENLCSSLIVKERHTGECKILRGVKVKYTCVKVNKQENFLYSVISL